MKIIEPKIQQENYNSRMEMTEDRISKIQDRTTEFTVCEQQREKRLKK